jgi:hypothetical protein
MVETPPIALGNITEQANPKIYALPTVNIPQLIPILRYLMVVKAAYCSECINLKVIAARTMAIKMITRFAATLVIRNFFQETGRENRKSAVPPNSPLKAPAPCKNAAPNESSNHLVNVSL